MTFQEQIADVLAPWIAMEKDEVQSLLEVPPEPSLGDFAFPCFRLAKTMRKAPPVIAAELKGKIDAPFLDKVEAVGGYVNFYLDKRLFARTTLDAVRVAGGRYGGSEEGKGKVMCLDYSSINIAKRFHIGHLSTTMIGHALRRLYTFLGYSCVGINHLGDWGTQFGKMIAAYLRWGDEKQVETGGVDALSALYVKFHEEAEQHPELEDEGRAWFKRIEEGDEEATRIFAWFKEITLKDAQRVYDMLGVTFDSYAGESFYNDKMGRVIDELTEKRLLVESQGAYVVDLEAEKMPPCIVLKKDGATLYATRDIAAALYRKDTYNFHRCLYVVAYQQDLHFRQWFTVVGKMGYAWAKDLEHVAFGMISYEGTTLSTRKGHVVYLDELLERAQQKALAIIEEKSPNLDNKSEVARQVGIGAVVFWDLFNSRIKDIDFWWDRVLNFDGETGPYVQYTHARACSVLRKADISLCGACEDGVLAGAEAQEVIRAIAAFPEAVAEAASRNEPCSVTRAVVEIAKKFNHYYYEQRILEGTQEEQRARLQLTDAVRQVIQTGLYLIGVEAPERM